jgi:hypothetical protein
MSEEARRNSRPKGDFTLYECERALARSSDGQRRSRKGGTSPVHSPMPFILLFGMLDFGHPERFQATGSLGSCCTEQTSSIPATDITVRVTDAHPGTKISIIHA